MAAKKGVGVEVYVNGIRGAQLSDLEIGGAVFGKQDLQAWAR